MRRWKNLVALAAFGTQIGVAIAQDGCGEFQFPNRGLGGPFDYRSAPAERISTVEAYHFTPDVEALRKGKSVANVGGDLDFTLIVFPNHHRALRSMSNLGFKLKTKRPPGAEYTVDCYFERALSFRPDDAVARMIYGAHLLKAGNPEYAIRELEKAKEAFPDNSNLLYNLGLAYFGLKKYEKSLEYARQAYALGFPLPGLRNMLQRAGKWSE